MAPKCICPDDVILILELSNIFAALGSYLGLAINIALFGFQKYPYFGPKSKRSLQQLGSSWWSPCAGQIISKSFHFRVTFRITSVWGVVLMLFHKLTSQLDLPVWCPHVIVVLYHRAQIVLLENCNSHAQKKLYVNMYVWCYAKEPVSLLNWMFFQNQQIKLLLPGLLQICHALNVLRLHILHLTHHIAVNSQPTLVRRPSLYSWQLSLLSYETLPRHRLVSSLGSCQVTLVY